MRPILVAIAGGSGSGKTWLADQLQAALGRRAARLSLDDFYRDRSRLSLARRNRINFDHPRAIEWRLFEAALRGCVVGRTVRIPRYDFATHCRRPQLRSFRPRPIVLVEGLWVLRSRALRRLYGLRIFIQCGARVRLRRRLTRDQNSRARSALSVRRQFQQTVEPMHIRHVAPQARWADVVLKERCDRREIAELARRLVSLGRQRLGRPS